MNIIIIAMICALTFLNDGNFFSLFFQFWLFSFFFRKTKKWNIAQFLPYFVCITTATGVAIQFRFCFLFH